MPRLFMSDGVKKILSAWAASVLVGSVVWLVGCSEGGGGAAGSGVTVSYVQQRLKQAGKMVDEKVRAQVLCETYDQAEALRVRYPDSEEVLDFWVDYDERMKQLPEDVYALALKTRSFDAFKWAVDHGVEVGLSYDELKAFWQYGRLWRNYLATEYSDAVLPLFMDFAADERDARFFDQHAERFKATGFQLIPPLEEADFYVNYVRYITMELKEALDRKDGPRLAFVLGQMPPATDVAFLSEHTKTVMKKVGAFVCHDLKDEALACLMVELGYPFGRINVARSGFGSEFVAALKENPDFALEDVLGLEVWEGALCVPEVEFVQSLSDEQLKRLHYRHLDGAVKILIGQMDAFDDAIRLMGIRAGLKPYVKNECMRMLERGVERGNSDIFEYVMKQCPEISIYNIDLVRLAGNYELFTQYAPHIFKKISQTMDRHPRADGTTLGRIHDVLVSRHHKAGLWIIQRMQLQDIWVDVTEGRTLLMDVCDAGNLPAARYLIERKKANVHADTGYMKLQASLFGRSESREGKLSPIFFAATSGNGELIRYLARKGAQVNDRSAYGATPLMYAVSANRVESVKVLLELRANVNAVMSSGLTRSELAQIGSYEEVATAYRRAVKNGNEEIIEMLKAAGARR